MNNKHEFDLSPILSGPKTIELTFTEEEWSKIIEEAKIPRMSRKRFINALCDLGWPRKLAKQIAKETDGHYGWNIEYYKLYKKEINYV